MRSLQTISILICIISLMVFVANTVDPVTAATIFGAVIAGVTATAQAASVLGQLAGDAVAIKIGNHFREVYLNRETEYIYDGEEYVTPENVIAPGKQGCAGGFDDGWWNAGGVAGNVRYSMTDQQANIKYCMDVLYANDQGDFGGYDGWAVAVGSDLCNLGVKAVFDDWFAHRGFFRQKSMGTGYAFGGNTWTSYGTAGNTGYSTTSNSDYKISWKVDMDANGVSALTVDVGPYNWWSKGDTFFRADAPVGMVDINDHSGTGFVKDHNEAAHHDVDDKGINYHDIMTYIAFGGSCSLCIAVLCAFIWSHWVQRSNKEVVFN